MSTIEIPVRELHARTGHYVRKASASLRVIVTDNGRPIAEIRPVGGVETAATSWEERPLLPGFKKASQQGHFAPKAGRKSIDEILQDVRADSAA